MATHVASATNISGLARALVQHGLMAEYEAEGLQTQAQGAGVSFVEQMLAGKRMTAVQLAVFASRAFGVPLLDLAAFDLDQVQKEYVDIKIAAVRRFCRCTNAATGSTSRRPTRPTCRRSRKSASRRTSSSSRSSSRTTSSATPSPSSSRR